MCMLITASAAVAATLIWYFAASDPKYKFADLVLMYWGAALMWLVDGFFALAAKEPFLDVSGDNALLGGVIVLCGAAVWMVLLLRSDPCKVFCRKTE